ncbi:MAG TPA: PAS domain S-box protein, partial [Herpetosiphonaceae bacterium]|nr:PAS domain S-box protein [Herpetosiphonaceae bacterium]
ASEARKGAILQAERDAIITIDHAGTITEFNPAAEDIFGYRQDEAVGHEMAGLIITPPLRERLRSGLAGYLTTGEGAIVGQRVELAALRADGTEFPVELTITRIPTDGPPAFTAFVRDITARKRAEAQQQFLVEASTLLAASLDYEATLTSLADLIVPGIADWCSVNLRDADGTLVRVAGRHVDPAKEAVLRALREQHPPDLSRPILAPPAFPGNRGTLIAEVTDAHLQQLAQNAEQLEVYRAMGFRSAMLVPLHLNTRLLGIMILATGESGRHYGEEDLALAEDLARRAALAIENARLYQEAQTAIQVRDAFLSIAAHELKTPVTAIMGYAQVLQRRAKQGDDPRTGRAAQVIAEQTERLSKLVGSLLEASRLETGQFTLDCQPLDLCLLVRRVVEEVALTLPVDSTHSLTCSWAEEAVIVAGDALRLEQVLHNLLQNAIKYSPQGGLISVQVARDADQAIIALSDQGIGIPGDAQANVFQRFYRAGNVRNDHISGMGIGLYVVKEIVSRHGGTVDVASVEGTGS